MYAYSDHIDENAVTLFHHSDIWEEALKTGEKSYRVLKEDGTEYYLEYIENSEQIPDSIKTLKPGVELLPSYKSYDVMDGDKMDLSILSRNNKIFFEEVNEYTVVIARLALKIPKMKLYFKDSRILDFIEKNERLEIVRDFEEDLENALYVEPGTRPGIWGDDYRKMGTIALFHNIFFWQALTDQKLENIKYAEICVLKTAGIGGILSYYSGMQHFFEEKNIKIYWKNTTRYPSAILDAMIRTNKKPENATKDNTIFIEEVTPFITTYYYESHAKRIEKELICKDLLCEMEKCADTICGHNRVLGVLIRGTDYVINGMFGNRKMATLQEVIPQIHSFMKKDSYDVIFVATEDSDILSGMQEEFGDKIRYLNQKRFSVLEMGDKKLLYELEKEVLVGDDVKENVISYLTSLYVLSKCDSFIASGQCHGVEVVTALAEKDFKRYCVLASEALIVDLKKLKKIGNGWIGAVYRYNQRHVIKVYNKSMPIGTNKQLIHNIYNAAKYLYDLQVKIPEAHGVLKTSEGYGIVFDYIDSERGNEYFIRNYDRLYQNTIRVVEFVRNMEKIVIDPSMLQSKKKKLQQRLEARREMVDSEKMQFLFECIDAVPDDNKLCHGDLHLKNMMINDSDIYMVDFDEFGYGHEIWEIVGIYRSYDLLANLDPEIKQCFESGEGERGKVFFSIFGVSQELAQEVWSHFINLYLKDYEEEVKGCLLETICAYGHLIDLPDALDAAIKYESNSDVVQCKLKIVNYHIAEMERIGLQKMRKGFSLWGK